LNRKADPDSDDIEEASDKSDIEAEDDATVQTSAATDAHSPEVVLSDIIASTASNEPSSVADKHTELEDKIVKEVIREYSKGEMFFAYSFGVYQTSSHLISNVYRSKI
jgi:hypothetical protein